MKKLGFILFLLGSWGSFVLAQPAPHFNFQPGTMAFFNPSALSFDELAYDALDNQSFVGQYRGQHLQSQGSAVTNYFAGYHQTLLPDGSRTRAVFSFGGYFNGFQVNTLNYTGISAKGALMLVNGKDPNQFTLSIGALVGASQFRVRKDNLQPWHLGDPLLDLENQSAWNINLGVGLFFNKALVGDKVPLYAGLAIPYIPAICRDGNCYNFKSTQGEFAIRKRLPVNGHLGLIWNYIKKSLLVNLEGFYRHIPNEANYFDFITRIEFDKPRLLLGVGYGSSETLHFEFGHDILERILLINISLDFYTKAPNLGPSLELSGRYIIKKQS